MLVRIERQQEAGESRCMIVYDDATFRAEHLHNGKTDVIEGSLDQGRYTEVNGMVQAKDFAAIQHEHLSTTMLAHNPDLVSVDVFRPEGLQAMRFANRDDRKSFSTQLDPLLKWFDGTQKIAGNKSSVAANRCLPANPEVTHTVLASSANSQAKLVEASAPASPAPDTANNPYHIPNLLLLFTQEKYESSEPIQLMYTPAEDTSKFGAASGTKDCLLVKGDGSGYFGRIKVEEGSKRYSEMRFTLSADQLTDLKHAMDEPVLAKSTELILKAPDGVAKEVQRAEVVAVRPDGTQRLLFRAASGITNVNSPFRGNETTGGRGNDGSKETAPLRGWMKKNVNAKQLEGVKQLSGECP